MNTVDSIPAQTLKNVTMVGTIVTYANTQYRVYSVEGYDYYAFQSANGGITCDFDMFKAEWKRDVYLYLLPMDAKIGEGRAIEVPMAFVTKGVCLAKSRH